MTIIKEQLKESKDATKKIDKKPVDIKILGAISNYDREGHTYYVATDGTSYYLFTGDKCTNANEFYQFKDDDDWPMPCDL